MRRSVAAAAEASADAARKLHEAGNTKALELETELAQADQARLDMASAEAGVLADRERLNRLMGLWGADVQWTLSPASARTTPPARSPWMGWNRGLSQAGWTCWRTDERSKLLPKVWASPAPPVWCPKLNLTAHYEKEIDGPSSFGPSVEMTLPIFNQGQPAICPR